MRGLRDGWGGTVGGREGLRVRRGRKVGRSDGPPVGGALFCCIRLSALLRACAACRAAWIAAASWAALAAALELGAGVGARFFFCFLEASCWGIAVGMRVGLEGFWGAVGISVGKGLAFWRPRFRFGFGAGKGVELSRLA